MSRELCIVNTLRAPQREINFPQGKSPVVQCVRLQGVEVRYPPYLSGAVPAADSAGEVVPGPPQSLLPEDDRPRDVPRESHFHRTARGGRFLCRRRGLHPGRSRSADRFGGFRGRGDRLRRSLGIGQGTPEPGRSCELPLNRDRREPIASDELHSSCAKAPFPGAPNFDTSMGQPVDFIGTGHQ